MSRVSIEVIIPLDQYGDSAANPSGDPAIPYNGFSVSGETEHANQHINVYYEIPDNGVMSANLPIISDEHGKWRAVFHGKFRPGTEITAHAKSDGAALVQITKII